MYLKRKQLFPKVYADYQLQAVLRFLATCCAFVQLWFATLSFPSLFFLLDKNKLNTFFPILQPYILHSLRQKVDSSCSIYRYKINCTGHYSHIAFVCKLLDCLQKPLLDVELNLPVLLIKGNGACNYPLVVADEMWKIH